MAERSLNSDAGAGSDRPVGLRFGPFTLNRTAAELRRGDTIVPLRPKAFDLLVVLATHPGEMLTKERLIEAVWPGVVVTDDSLTQCVHELRQALGDDGAALVRTVPRRGYRFDAAPAPASAQVSAPASAQAEALADGSPAAAPLAVPAAPRFHRRRRALLALVGLLIVAGVAAVVTGWRIGDRSAPFQTPADLARAPLPREAPPLSIVVLPLTLEGEAKDAEWLADALHGDLVVEVSRLNNSHVIARDTAATYKGRAADPRQVARELGVRHVVQGSLRQEGQRLRLSVVLVDGETGAQRWAEVFETDRGALAQAVGDFAVAIERTLVGELLRSTVDSRTRLSPAETTIAPRRCGATRKRCATWSGSTATATRPTARRRCSCS